MDNQSPPEQPPDSIPEHADLAVFEQRLRAIEPVSPSPQLKAQISRSLDARPWFAQPQWIAVAGLAAAACLLLTVFVWPTTPAPQAPVNEMAQQSESPDPIKITLDPPIQQPTRAITLMSYHRALRESPETVEALFDLPTTTHHRPAAERARPLTAMDAKMFLHENERCDG